MAGFLEAPRFPTSISFQSSGGPWFMTALAAGVGGDERRTGQWPRERGQWDLSLTHRTEQETRDLLAFFYCVAKGRANGFRFHDFGPGEGVGIDEPLGVGDGATHTYQLNKRYTIDAVTYDRMITKPVPGTVKPKVNGVLIAADRYSVDTVLGTVTFFDIPPTGEAVTATFEFDCPVRFNTDWLAIRRLDPHVYSWENIELVELQALSGVEMQASQGNPLIEHWEYEETTAATIIVETEHF